MFSLRLGIPVEGWLVERRELMDTGDRTNLPHDLTVHDLGREFFLDHVYRRGPQLDPDLPLGAAFVAGHHKFVIDRALVWNAPVVRVIFKKRE